jgi:hypothetical protein
MARSTYRDNPPGNRTDRLRRYLNATRNAETFALFQNRRNRTVQQQQLLTEQERFRDENILDNPYEDPPPDESQQEDVTSDEEDEEDDCNWVVIDEEEPVNPIDALIEARKELHRQQARQYNYSQMIDSLHSVYMTLKFKTDNWAATNSYDDFRHCNCLPHNKTQRPVDLIDISGLSSISVVHSSEALKSITFNQQGSAE